MEPLSLPPSAGPVLAGLPASTALEAVVARVLGGDRYLLEIFGRPLEVISPTPLPEGTTLSVQWESQGGVPRLRVLTASSVRPDGGAVLSPPPVIPAVPGPAASAALEALGLPETPARLAAARALVAQGAPVTRENLMTVERFAGPEAASARVQAAAWLLAHGVRDVEGAGEPLAGLLAAPARVAELIARVAASAGVPVPSSEAGFLPIVRAAPSPDWLAQINAGLSGRIERLLAEDGGLVVLDRLLARLPPARPETGALSPELRASIEAVLGRPDDARAVAALVERLDRLPVPEREAAAAFLAQREREAIDRHPGIAAARDALAAVRELGDRAGAERAMNLLTHARGESRFVFEVPVFIDGRGFAVALKVRRDGRGTAGAAAPAQASVMVRVELSEVGLVTCMIGVRERRANVSFRVRDAEWRRRFQQHSPELQASLARLGLNAVVDVDVRAEGEDEWIAWLLDLPAGDRPGLDVRA